MSITLDTNTLIRFFTNDVPEKAEAVEKLIQSKEKIIVPDVVFPELEYVLLNGYHISKPNLIEAYKFLLAQDNISTSSYIKIAIYHYENSKLDMADCIIAAQSKKGKLASFDKELLEITGIKPFWKNVY